MSLDAVLFLSAFIFINIFMWTFFWEQKITTKDWGNVPIKYRTYITVCAAVSYVCMILYVLLTSTNVYVCSTEELAVLAVAFVMHISLVTAWLPVSRTCPRFIMWYLLLAAMPLIVPIAVAIRIKSYVLMLLSAFPFLHALCNDGIIYGSTF